MLSLFSRIFDLDGKAAALWCSLMHDSPMWPIHGHYECRACGRQYRVTWAEARSNQAAQVPQAAVPQAQLWRAAGPFVSNFSGR